MNAGIEAETIWRAQRGDAASLEQIYASHRRRVYGICLRMVRNPSDAEDLMQETFIQVIRKIHAFRGESAFSTWLYRVTKNVVLMRLRKRRPWVASLEEVLQEGVDSDHQLLQFAVNYSLFSPEIRRLELERAIEKLPPVHQRVLVLHDVLGYQHRTIGRMIGLTESNSKSQLRRARMRLGRMLGQADGGKNRCSNAVKRASAERK